MRWVSVLSVAAFVATSYGALRVAQAEAKDDKSPESRPNIVLIVADDLGYGDLGFQGGKDIPTPNIDSLAKQGVHCTSGYVSGPYCSPTRAGLLTGRYQQRFGHEFNPGPQAAANFGLPLDQTTIAQRLQEAGYKTGLVGKWHLGDSEKHHPLSRGFDEFFGFLGGAHPYFLQDGQQPIFRGFEKTDEKEYLTDAFSREATAFVDRHKSEPFFLYYAFNAVHNPLQATEKYLSRFADIADPKRKSYAGMLSAMDDAVGQLLATLERNGQSENTLILFISDNGGPTQGNASNNGPLRGVKAQVWDGGVRVPFVVRWPARLPAGKTYDQPVIQLDLFPTILAAAAAPSTAAQLKLDGVDLLPFLSGKSDAAPHDHLYWRMGGQWAIRSGDLKLVKAPDIDKPQLFDVVADIGERHDLSAEKPDQVAELTTTWQAWDKELAAPLWTPAKQPVGGKKAGNKGKKAKAKAAAEAT